MTRTPFHQAPGEAGAPLAQLASGDGSAAHRHLRALADGGRATDSRDLADAVHHLCLLHGRHPGVIDHAAQRVVHEAARGWIVAAADAFALERAVLARLTAAAGPLPSTPGQAVAEAAIVTQRHALDMLAQSDRTGCAIGAALALAIDWFAVRDLFAAAALRFGIDLDATLLPPAFETSIVAAAVADRAPVERAMLFGADQLLAQQRAMWDILEARAEARA